MFDKPKVLFLCTGHPERSEMAEGFLRSFAGESMIPVSAAIEPAPVSPLAVDTMKEVGIDISRQQIKDVKGAFQERFAYAVGLGDQSKERCPVFPFAFRIFRWSLEDPTAVQGSTEERLIAFRRVRNQIDYHVRESLTQISHDAAQPMATR
jgi:arsenate reductase